MRDVSSAQAFGELSTLVKELSALYRGRTIREITQRESDYGPVEEWMRPEEWMGRGYGSIVRRAKNLKSGSDYLLAVKVFTPPKRRQSTVDLLGKDPAAEPLPQTLEQGTQVGYARVFPNSNYPQWIPSRLDESERMPTYVVISGAVSNVRKSEPIRSGVPSTQATQLRIGLGPSDIFVFTAPFEPGFGMLDNLEASVAHLSGLGALFAQRRIAQGHVLTGLAIRSAYAPIINEGLDASSNFAAIKELTLHPGERNNALYLIKPGAPKWEPREKAMNFTINGG